MRRTITPKAPVKPRVLRARMPSGGNVGVDFAAKRLNGYVVAQKGPFKDGRGEFDDDAIDAVVRLMSANDESGGTKSHFTHSNISDDGLGTYLGRARNPRRDGDMVRADLHFADSAFDTPRGDLAGYVMRLAAEDPDAISSSLVLDAEEEFRLDRRGIPLEDGDGNILPPLWRPTKIHGSDIVKIGNAVDGLLQFGDMSVRLDGGPDEIVAIASEFLDRAFADGCSRDLVESRCMGFLRRYLDNRFGAVKNHDIRILVDRSRRRVHNLIGSRAESRPAQ